LRDAIITLTQLEQSLRAQVLSGGRLGTNLVELGFIDLNTLGRYLARSMDLPLAIADRLEKADPVLVDKLGAELADRHSAIPLGNEVTDPQTIGVVMGKPTDRRSISAIEEALGSRIQPYVAAELRLFYYLERYYGIRRKTRFTRSAKSDESVRAPASRRERRSTQPFRGLTTPAAVRIAPRREREARANHASQPPPAKVLTLDTATALVDEARDRNEIGEAILRYTIGRFECSAFFLVRESNAIGWMAQAVGLGRASLERFSIPLGGASVFQAAHDSNAPYRGPAVSAGHTHESELWKLFALDYEPHDMHVIPLRSSERIVNLLYAHSLPGQDAADEDIRGLILLAGRAEQAYRRLVASTHAD
tara:strand:- start:29272 stop:30363 length:1092 start_codon:yes stop_codon:yes gene_type:complete